MDSESKQIEPKDEEIYLKGKTAEFLEFIKFCAVPEPFRDIKTQNDFALKYNVGVSTLSHWKEREGFWEAVKEENRRWGRAKTPNVMAAMYRNILKKGGAQEVKLWQQVYEGFAERQEIDEHSKQVIYELAPGSDAPALEPKTDTES